MSEGCPSLFKTLLPFTDTFFGLFTRWINEINQEDLGNNSSDVLGYKLSLQTLNCNLMEDETIMITPPQQKVLAQDFKSWVMCNIIVQIMVRVRVIQLTAGDFPTWLNDGICDVAWKWYKLLSTFVPEENVSQNKGKTFAFAAVKPGAPCHETLC